MAFSPIQINTGTNPFHIDKAKHLLAFFVLAFIIDRTFLFINLYIRIFILVVFAFMIEVIQSFIGREFSIWDFVFSVLGVFAYLVLKNIIKK
jgi:VanZ family protein